MSTHRSLTWSNIQSPFHTSAQVWEVINKRVFLVRAGQMGGEYNRYKDLPNYTALVDVSNDWYHTTFRNLIALATQLREFASQRIRQELQALDQVTDQLLASPQSAALHQEFDRLMNVLTQELDQLNQSIQATSGRVKVFCDVNQEADFSYSPIRENQWTVLDPSPNRLLEATGRVEGAWEAVVSDVRDLREFVSTSIRDEMPFMVDLNVNAAIEAWRVIETEATEFLQQASGQQGLLEGHWLYDDPVIDENARYRLSNRFLGDHRFLDTYSDSNNSPFMNQGENTSGSYWRFRRLGAGWYRMTNDFLGDHRFLDTYSGTSNRPFMNQGENTSGTYWKFMPLGDGTYRLINMFLGQGRALDTYSDSHEPFMNSGEVVTGMCWRLTKV